MVVVAAVSGRLPRLPLVSVMGAALIGGRCLMLRRHVLELWLFGNVIGGALLALPDSDDRSVSLGRTHGPSQAAPLVIASERSHQGRLTTLAQRRLHGVRGT